MSWARFAKDEERLSEFVRERLHGRIAYLATIAPGGGPRLHPVTPVIDGRRLLVFMEPASPKGHDLRRDPRYALHCGVEDARGGPGEVLIRGRGRVPPPSEEPEPADAPPAEPAAAASASAEPGAAASADAEPAAEEPAPQEPAPEAARHGAPPSRYVMFELSVDEVLITRAGSEGSRHLRWRAPESKAAPAG